MFVQIECLFNVTVLPHTYLVLSGFHISQFRFSYMSGYAKFPFHGECAAPKLQM